MSSPINEKTLKHLAELARINLDSREEKKLLADLQKILEHFEELKSLDASGIKPMTGGTYSKNVFREDESPKNTNQEEGVEQFPEADNEFLKVPPVFENK